MKLIEKIKKKQILEDALIGAYSKEELNKIYDKQKEEIKKQIDGFNEQTINNVLQGIIKTKDEIQLANIFLVKRAYNITFEQGVESAKRNPYLIFRGENNGGVIATKEFIKGYFSVIK